MNAIEIPTLLFWENGNCWYGSLGNARFFIKPSSSKDPPEKLLTVQFWQGPLAMELSEILATATFPISEEGLAQTSAWLEERAAAINKTQSTD